MVNRRFLCRKCTEKEGKSIVKEFKGQSQEKCDICGEDMELQRELLGEFGKSGPEISLGWVKC